MREKYICRNCGRTFDEPDELHTSYEAYYGVSSDFMGCTPVDVEVCPYCGEDEFEENEEEEEEEEE